MKNKMQEKISDDVQLVQSLNPIRDAQKVPAIDDDPDFDDLLDKVDKFELLMKKKIEWAPNLIRYLPGMMNLGNQGLVYN